MLLSNLNAFLNLYFKCRLYFSIYNYFDSFFKVLNVLAYMNVLN